LGADPSDRAEDLSVHQWVELSNLLPRMAWLFISFWHQPKSTCT
jgi:hypothetical protein